MANNSMKQKKIQMRKVNKNDFLALASNTHNIVICLTLDFSICEYNKAAENWFGLSKNQILGKNYEILCQEQTIQSPFPKNCNHILRGKTVQKIQLYEINKRIIWNISRLTDLRGTPNGFLLIGEQQEDLRGSKLAKEERAFFTRQVKEITGQEPSRFKTIQDYIKSIRAYYEKIISCMPNNVYWLDRNCITLGCNDNVVKFVKLKSQKEFIGINYEQMGQLAGWDPSVSRSFKHDDMQVMDSGIPIVNKEEPPVYNDDGSLTYYLTNRVPLRDDSGKVIGVVGISIDISDRKKMEQDLIKTKEQAEIASQLKTQFIQNMEHDLRTPLSHIIGLAEILCTSKILQKENLKIANYIHISVQRLLSLIDEILQFIDDDTGNIPVFETPFKLKEVAQKIIELMMVSAKQKGLSLLIEFDESIPEYLIGDSVRINRILLNLIGNAIKFTETGYVKLVVKAHKRLQQGKVIITFEIIDTGIGIPKDKYQVIFERFTRLIPANTNLYKGLGLGLSIVKQFVEDLHGYIKVTSRLKHGSKFTCTLSFLRASPQDIASNQSSATSKQTSDIKLGHILQPKILLIEDEPLAQFIEIKFLNKLGCTVDTASTGQEAEEKLKKYHYDLILMDFGLPDTDGIELTKKIRNELFIKTPLVALTAHSFRKKGALSLQAGINEFITKPISEERSKKIIQSWFKK